MKKIFIPCLLLLCMIFSATSVKAATLPEHPIIAVWEFKNKAAKDAKIPERDASLLIDFFIENLEETERFKLVEREYLMTLMKELSYQSDGMVDESTARSAGKQLGAQFIVVGSITELSSRDSGASGGDSALGNIGFSKYTVSANVSARIIDVETGEIVKSFSGMGESVRSNAELSINKKYYEDYETDTEDSAGIPNIAEGRDSRVVTRTIKIGSNDIALNQARNALYKAVEDSIYNKKFGLLAKMDGKSKRRKV